jgi:hypothetical protein
MCRFDADDIDAQCSPFTRRRLDHTRQAAHHAAPFHYAISTTFGTNVLKSFSVTTREADGRAVAGNQQSLVA